MNTDASTAHGVAESQTGLSDWERHATSTVALLKFTRLCGLVAQSFLTLCDPTNCSLSGSSIHGILQARILEWNAIPLSRGSSWPRDRAKVSCIAGRFFAIWATGKTPVVAQAVKCLLTMRDTLVQSLGWEDLPEISFVYFLCIAHAYYLPSFNQLYWYLKLSHFSFTVQWVLTKIQPCNYHQCQNIEPVYHQVRNRFKGLDLIECLMNYGWRLMTLYRRQGSRPSPRKRNAKKQNGCLRRPYK